MKPKNMPREKVLADPMNGLPLSEPAVKRGIPPVPIGETSETLRTLGRLYAPSSP